MPKTKKPHPLRDENIHAIAETLWRAALLLREQTGAGAMVGMTPEGTLEEAVKVQRAAEDWARFLGTTVLAKRK